MSDTITPQLLSREQLSEYEATVRRSHTTHESNVVHWYQQDVPALLGHVAALEQAARYIPVTEALPTKLTEAGWSEAVQVCTDGRVNIFPHNYMPARNGKPGYWIQVGEPHQVKNVTHWREFADDPAPIEAAAPVGYQADLNGPHHVPGVLRQN